MPANRRWSYAALALAALVLFSPSLLASTHSQDVLIPVQGLLAGADGVAVEGPVAMHFSLFDADDATESVWSESQQVVVEAGLFTLHLGALEPLAAALFHHNGQLYLELRVGEDDAMERWPLGVTPFAAHAHFAGNAARLEGRSSAELRADATAYDNSGSGLTATTLPSALDEILARLAALEQQSAQALASVESRIEALESENAALVGQLEALELALATSMEATQEMIDAQAASIGALEELTAPMTRETIDEQDSIAFTNVNVHVRSGSATTHGTINGRGNLIVGYNALRPESDIIEEPANIRTGSHNLIVGDHHNYASYGGFVTGSENAIMAAFSSVNGGHRNTASGPFSSVSGGATNTAAASYSSVSGGSANTASGNYSSISGGSGNTASGSAAAVAGGQGGLATGNSSAVSGGYQNRATGAASAVSGGSTRTASGAFSWSGGEYTSAM
ncbi:MAG: hypothetical protein H0U74_08150 [Bradymonadaceae bacterium]|nr:hypothetical protein [Lujinxingiaceae bacterium]